MAPLRRRRLLPTLPYSATPRPAMASSASRPFPCGGRWPRLKDRDHARTGYRRLRKRGRRLAQPEPGARRRRPPGCLALRQNESLVVQESLDRMVAARASERLAAMRQPGGVPSADAPAAAPMLERDRPRLDQGGHAQRRGGTGANAGKPGPVAAAGTRNGRANTHRRTATGISARAARDGRALMAASVALAAGDQA